MPEDFKFDVFLSHSTNDKPVVRELAARLKKDGVRVWLDDEQIKPGDNIPVRIEEGLENSRVLALCMSVNASGSKWLQLESYTFRFRDPLNKDRRFIPLRLDDTPFKGSLTQFRYINWHPAERENNYAELLEACSNPLSWPRSHAQHPPELPSSIDRPKVKMKEAVLGDCDLVVVKVVFHAWNLKDILNSSGIKTRRLVYSWTDSVLQLVRKNRIDVAIYNQSKVKHFLNLKKNRNCGVLMALEDACCSMTGDNAFLLARTKGAPTFENPKQFLNAIRGRTLAVPLDSDIESAIHRLFKTTRKSLARLGINLIHSPAHAGLEVFDKNPKLILSGGQNIRFQAAKQRGRYKIYRVSEYYDEETRQYLREHAQNCVIVSPRLAKRFEHDDIRTHVRNAWNVFHNGWRSPQDRPQLLRSLCDELHSAFKSRPEAKFVVQSILSGTYGIGKVPRAKRLRKNLRA